jgi:hypothetical protein
LLKKFEVLNKIKKVQKSSYEKFKKIFMPKKFQKFLIYKSFQKELFNFLMKSLPKIKTVIKKLYKILQSF